jgi:hypothetical protein
MDKGVIQLTWSHEPDNGQAVAYVVLQAQRALSQPQCPGCPLVFQKAGTVQVDRAGRNTKHTLAFSEALAAGFRYTFTVRPISASGAQGPDSNSVVTAWPEQGGPTDTPR